MLVGTNNVDHFPFIKDDDVLLGRGIAKPHFFLEAHGLDFPNGAFKEIRLMATIANVRGRKDFFRHIAIQSIADTSQVASPVVPHDDQYGRRHNPEPDRAGQRQLQPDPIDQQIQRHQVDKIGQQRRHAKENGNLQLVDGPLGSDDIV